jgi:hypothetical protein
MADRHSIQPYSAHRHQQIRGELILIQLFETNNNSQSLYATRKEIRNPIRVSPLLVEGTPEEKSLGARKRDGLDYS